MIINEEVIIILRIWNKLLNPCGKTEFGNSIQRRP